MTIGLGTRVGPYEVTALLGEGGMGKVWRAHHLALKRDNALKVLPEAFAADPDRLARFRREAQVLASLNHPNIAQVHGLEEADGSQALIMELVEGPTLAKRTGKGPIPVEEALAIARQIAEALQAAHEQGIIHRDLKPANVKLRPDGTVKVLDFGLAKVMEAPHAQSPSLTQSPTITTPLTQAGVILGTAAYMSPEQAKGQPVDRRSDVWAFGAVLYELLTGRRAFDGPTVPETLAAVLERTPDWSRLPASVSRPVRVLLRRCLARDARQRVHDMGAVLFVLEEHGALSAEASSVPSHEPVASRIRRAALLGAAVLAVSATMAAGFLWLAYRPAPSPVVRTTIAADTFTTATDRSFALTPDGSLAYISGDARQIFVRPVDELDPLPILTTTAYLRGMFSSPDGNWLGYVENAFTLKKIPVAGGPPVTVLQMDGPSRGAAWGPGDTIVFATGAAGTGLQQVAASGGPETVLTRPDPERGEADHVQPEWLPDGRHLLFTILGTSGGLDAAKVAVLDLATGSWRTVVDGGHAARYVDSGHLVYAAAGGLWATRFDLSRLETEGASIKVLQQVGTGAIEGSAHFDIALNGTFAYPRGVPDDSDGLVPVWVDREGRETLLSAPPRPYKHPRLAPDGKRLAIVANWDIYVWDMGRPWSTASRTTFSPAIDWFPVWTLDGQRIVFGSWRGGGFSNLYIQEPDEAAADRLTDSDEMQLPTGIAPDGSTVVFHSFTRRLEALRLEEPRHVVALVDTPLEERNGVISPDGRWLAYEGENPTRPGQLDVHVRPFPEVDRAVWQVTNGGGTYPVWGPGGRELFYRKHDGTMVVVPVEAAGTTWSAGSHTELFRGPYLLTDGTLGRQYDLAPDGRRFLMLKNVGKATAEQPHFVVVQNWREELKRLLPAR